MLSHCGSKTTPTGIGGIRQGVAKDRIVSPPDLEMRHGRPRGSRSESLTLRLQPLTTRRMRRWPQEAFDTWCSKRDSFGMGVRALLVRLEFLDPTGHLDAAEHRQVLWSAQVDDAEGVTVRVSQHHEVRVGRLHVPIQPDRAQANQPLDLRYLLGSIVDEQIDMNTGVGVRG